MKKLNIVLASGSPRRIQIMKQKGYDPIVLPAEVDETLPFSMGMETAVMYLACKKALWAESNLDPALKATSPVILSADTIVYKDRIIGKPSSPQEASEILLSLRNDWHYVATGVCLLCAGQPVRKLFYEITKVFFKDYSQDDLETYIRTSEPYDKAGGYAIQGTFSKYIHHIEGDYDNVVGFPWTRIETELAKL